MILRRKGMFRRQFHRRVVRRLQAEIPPLFQRANELFASGEYAEAALAFESLARGAQLRGLPRAGHLFLRAGRCHLLARQVLPGMADLQLGLSLIASQGSANELSVIGQRIIAELEQNGLTAQAGEMRAWLDATLPRTPHEPIPGTPSMKATLPTACPSCGGPIFSNEVEWVDEVTAQCPYCGGGVRGEA
jgi:hypothetical protein